MIIIQAEDGAIVTDPKKIYIDNDLDGHLHIYLICIASRMSHAFAIRLL